MDVVLMHTQKFFCEYLHGDLPQKFCPLEVLYYKIYDIAVYTDIVNSYINHAYSR